MAEEKNSKDLFISLCSQKGFQCKNPTKEQFNNFINLILIGQENKKPKKVSLCLKLLKSKSKSKWLWVEIKNKHGNPGWIYGSSDFIVFELTDEFLFIPRSVLLNHIYENIDSKSIISSSSWDSKYKIYQRPGFFDQITQVKTDKIKKLKNAYLWPKNLKI